MKHILCVFLFVCFLLHFICYIKHGSLSSRLLNIWILTSNCHWFSCFWFSFIYIFPRSRQWHPTPVLLPGKSHGRRSLVGCSPWGREESDMTERLHFHFPALEKEMATHSSILAWRIPGTGEPGGLPSMWSHRVRHDIFPSGSVSKESACNSGDLGSSPGLRRSSGGEHGNPLQYSSLENPHGQRILACCSPWDHRVRHNWMTKYSTALKPRASQVALVVKNLPANARHIREAGSIPGSGTSPEGGHGNLFLYSSLENPMNRGAWWATVHRISKNQTQLKWLNRHALKPKLVSRTNKSGQGRTN